MTAEEALKDLQNKKPPTKKEVVRKNWVIGIVLTSTTVLSITTTLYAFVQQTEAKRQEQLAMEIMQRSKEFEYELIKNKQEMNQQWMLAEQQRLIAVEALEACKSSQRKK